MLVGFQMILKNLYIMKIRIVNTYFKTHDYIQNMSSSHGNEPRLRVISKLGKGVYAKVYKCFDVEQRKYRAVKIVKGTKNEGMPCLMEYFIVKGISHPYLIGSTDTYIKNNKLYIIQKLAQIDLRSWRVSNIPSENQLKKWTFQLVDALLCLHKIGIVHADIKADNLLLMKNGSIKLADFSLSKITSGERAISCASEHRSPEIWKSETISRLIDVWSLGCTLIEIAYLILLFRRQEDKTFEEEKVASLKAISHWEHIRIKILRGEYSREYENSKYKDAKGYIPPRLPNSFDPDTNFNKFILFLLDPDYNSRPNLFHILNHPYMEGFKSSVWEINCMKFSPIPDWVTNSVSKYTTSKEISRLALDFYSQLQNQIVELSVEMSERDLFETCIWMSYKVVRSYPPPHDRFITKLENLINFESVLLKEADFTIFKCPK